LEENIHFHTIIAVGQTSLQCVFTSPRALTKTVNQSLHAPL